MRRRLPFADVSLVLLAAAGLAGAPRPARADWQVHRDGTQALIERAEQALIERPDDAAIARRLVNLAGRRGAIELRARFQARAAGATSYAPVAAYAQLLAAMGESGAAAHSFAEALRLTPGSAAALLGRAQALAAAGDKPAAIEAYDNALAYEHRPAGRRRLIEAELELGPPALSGADLERAIERRRELCELAPESDREAERLADLLEQAGRPREGAVALERRVPRAHPTAKLALALRAVRLRAADHDTADAARAADALAALLDDLPRAASDRRRSVWSCARDVARLRGTLGDLEKQLRRSPGPIEWDLLGQVRDELGDLDGALAATRTAHALAPRDAAVGRRLIGLLGRLGRDADAITVYQDLERRIPGDSALTVELAERQRAHDDRAAAESTFDRALARFARTPRALDALAELAARWGDDRRALAAWTRLSHLDPNDELALVGLGEAQFQLGHRDQARRTWSSLRARAGSAADGHLRLGELLYDHELLEDAADEAKHAAAAAPSSAEPHRLLARIAERQRRPAVAQEEWRRVLDLGRTAAAGPNGVGLRREARTHLLALIAAQGRGRLDTEVRRLHEEAARHPDDVEATLFLAEAEQRLGDVGGAIETLRGLLARATTAGPPGRETAVEAGFALSRLLKRTGQLDEAAARLTELARLVPGRAREAELQLADLALDRGDVVGALGHADAAEPGADPTALVRIAEIRERTGDDARAVATYQKAAADGGPPSAALAVARILARQADAAGAAAAIETLLATAHDDASLSDAARRILILDEYLNRLPALAEALQPNTPDGEETPARRRALVDVLRRSLPQLARDPAGDEARARIGRLALRPLLDLVADAEAPNRDAIELVGLLGNPDATPALARLVKQPPNAPPRAPRGAFDLRQVALIALGRLGSPRALDVLEPATTSGSRDERAAAVWAIGRVDDPTHAADARIVNALRRVLDDPRPDLQALACLGLGRHDADGKVTAQLARVALDAGRTLPVRQAAVAALGRAGGPTAAPPLLELADDGDDLAHDAMLALARTRDPRALALLLARALLPADAGVSAPEAPLAALAIWQAAGPPSDDARAVTGNTVAVSAVLAVWTAAPRAGDLSALWRPRVRELGDLLSAALARGGSARRAALDALDSRADGPGLGALAPTGDASCPRETLAAIHEIAGPLADGVAAALDDPERGTRAVALRVLAKLDDDRATPARLAEAAADGSPVLAAASADAARLLVQAHPALATTIATSAAPLLTDDGAPGSWTRRLSAVQLLAVLGVPARPSLERAAADRNAMVRAAALEALGRGAPRAAGG